MDNFSKFIVIRALEDRKSKTVAKWFYQNINCMFGTPELVKSNGGGEFEGLFEKLCKEFGVKHNIIVAYHP